MMLEGTGKLLRIYIGEKDRHEGMLLYEWLLRKAREQGLAGATVLRGMAGFGAHSRLHTGKILELSTDLPAFRSMATAIRIREERIEAFLHVVDAAVGEGLATLENVTVHLYRSGRPGDTAGKE